MFQVKLGWHHILGTPYILHVAYLYGVIVEYFSINYILIAINNTRANFLQKKKTRLQIKIICFKSNWDVIIFKVLHIFYTFNIFLV